MIPSVGDQHLKERGQWGESLSLGLRAFELLKQKQRPRH